MTAPRDTMCATPLNRIPPADYLASLISDLLLQGTEGDETPRVVMQARSQQAARVIATFCAPLASAPVRAEEPTGLCAGRLCDKRWGDGCPDVDPSLETYHLCYTAAGTPCRCSCGSAPPAAAEAADLTALAEAAEEVVCRYIGGSPLNGALGDAIDRLATALPTTRRDDT
jgi:hypothetical protein